VWALLSLPDGLGLPAPWLLCWSLSEGWSGFLPIVVLLFVAPPFLLSFVASLAFTQAQSSLPVELAGVESAAA